MFYKRVFRPLLFRIHPEDPEVVHQWTLKSLALFSHIPFAVEGARRLLEVRDFRLERKLWGLTFPNLLGLAAGFDKNAEAFLALQSFGFGFIEVGTITAHAQEGNSRPRLFRLDADQAIINRMGFNNHGADVISGRLSKMRHRLKVPLGISIGKSKITPIEQAKEDYCYSLRKLYHLGDFFEINVSSPNTPGLRKLQDKKELDELLKILTHTAQGLADAAGDSRRKPMLLKVSPDMPWSALDQVIEVCLSHHLDGLVAINTSTARPPLLTSIQETGGLSGRPMRQHALEVVRYVAKHTKGAWPIIGVGGIFSALDAYDMLQAGASLVKIYSSLIFEGPGIVRSINKGLLTVLHRHNSVDLPATTWSVKKKKSFFPLPVSLPHLLRKNIMFEKQKSLPLKILEDTGAIITKSHIVYTSGRHGSAYINKDSIYPHSRLASVLGHLIAQHFFDRHVEAVIAPALGGIILQMWVAYHLSHITGREIPGVYAEKEIADIEISSDKDVRFRYETGRFVIKRGYDMFIRGKRVLILEDVMTTGGSVRKVVDVVRDLEAEIIGVGVISNRGGITPAQIGVPEIFSLVELPLESWPEDECKLCDDNVPINMEVGKGKEFLTRQKKK